MIIFARSLVLGIVLLVLVALFFFSSCEKKKRRRGYCRVRVEVPAIDAQTAETDLDGKGGTDNRGDGGYCLDGMRARQELRPIVHSVDEKICADGRTGGGGGGGRQASGSAHVVGTSKHVSFGGPLFRRRIRT